MTGMEALVIGGALAAAGAGVSYATGNAAANARRKAQSQWMQWQKEKRNKLITSEEENRRKADAARQAGLGKLANMNQTVEDETQRLTEDLGQGNVVAKAPEAASDKLLAGSGSNPDYKNYVAGQIANAAKAARDRTAALAASQAFTGGQFGLQNTNANTLRESGDWIDMFNNWRSGNNQIYGVARSISPKQVAPSPWEGVGSAMSGFGGTIAGGGF